VDAQIVSVLEDGRSHGINCLEGKEIAEFRTVLLQVAETTRVFHEPLPKTWKDLREKIRGIGTTKKYIAWVEYKEMCKQCGIKDNMVLVVTFFLNETLDLRFFGSGSHFQRPLQQTLPVARVQARLGSGCGPHVRLQNL
jgi:hypothetical protein